MVILHGLLGSSRNWHSIAQILSDKYYIYCLDARNHGKSPHSDEMSYQLLVSDVREWASQHKLDSFTLMGHSMGGKTAMKFAIRNPQLIHQLVIVDISPRTYHNRHEANFTVLNEFDLSQIKSRNQADEALKEKVPDPNWRAFLLSNLIRNPDGSFSWQINLPVLTQAANHIVEGELRENAYFEKPTLFIRGELSDYVDPIDDYNLIRNYFRLADVQTVTGAGHNTHIDNTEGFLKILNSFLAPPS